MAKTFLIGCLLVWLPLAMADTLSEGKALAEGMNAKIKQSASSDANMPKAYQGAQVPETQLYDSGASLETKALDKVATDPDAQELYLQNANRPRVVLDPDNDPMLIHAQKINAQATDFMNSGFQGCITLGSQGEMNQSTTQHCYVKGYQEAVDFACTETQTASCGNTDAGESKGLPFANVSMVSHNKGVELTVKHDGVFQIKTDVRLQNCGKFYQDEFTITVPVGYEIAQFTYTPKTWDDWLLLVLNDRIREGAAAGAWWTHAMVGGSKDLLSIGSPGCEQYLRNSNKYHFDLLPYAMTQGGTQNRLVIYHRVGGTGQYKMELKIRLRKICETEFTASHTCTNGQTDSALDKVALGEPYCSDASPLTRAIPGTVFTATRDCWQETREWRIWKAPVYVEDDQCAVYRAQGCQQVNSGSCQLTHERGYCLNSELEFACGTHSGGGTTELCSSELKCQNGECTEEYNQPYDATADFQKAMATLAMVDEAAINLDQDTLGIWEGKALSCKKSGFGVKNCCRNDGWGLDVGVTSCSSGEKELGLAKQAGKVIYVGKEDGGSWPDEWTKYKYCVYPTKLARIVMEQAIPLLGETFGNYYYPNCRALLLKEFTALDFDAIDLSEYFADVMKKANTALADMPTTEELLDRVRENMEALQQ